MGIRRIKNPVEFHFTVWMNNHPDSTHWADKDRFRVFVRAVCSYRTKHWRCSDYVKKKILEARPHFDPVHLEYLMQLFDELIAFHKTYLPSALDPDLVTSPGHYLELEAKNGKIITREKAEIRPEILTGEELQEALREWRSKRQQ